MFQEKEVMEMVEREGSTLVYKTHLHEVFYVYLPEDVSEREFKFECKFKNIPDMVQGKLI